MAKKGTARSGLRRGLVKIGGIPSALTLDVGKTEIMGFISNLDTDNLAGMAMIMGLGIIVAYILTCLSSRKSENKASKHQPIVRQIEAEKEKFNPDGSRSIIRFKYTEVFKMDGYFS